MSVPHLDTRVVDGRQSLLFGPFAGIKPKFLKNGSVFDLPLSVRPKNLLPYLSVALKNLDLLVYLVREISKSKKAKLDMLRDFVPTARPEDWTYYEAGQRAQIIKPSGRLGTLQFGTEVVSSADGTIAGLLGASPGASVSVWAMLDVMERMVPEVMDSYVSGELAGAIEGFRTNLNSSPSKAKRLMSASAKTLRLRK